MAKEVERITVPQIDWDEFVEKAKAVYEQLKPQLLPQYKGLVIAIEPESGDYEVGQDDDGSGSKVEEAPSGQTVLFRQSRLPNIGKVVR